jgi:transposase
VNDLLSRHELTDEEWALLAPLLPAHPRQGHRWNDHRVVINGILFRTRTGCPWRDLPDCYGNWKSVYGRHRRWSLDGTWEKMLDRLRAGCDAAEGPDWTVSADSTVVRAHQYAAAGAAGVAGRTAQGGPSRVTGMYALGTDTPRGYCAAYLDYTLAGGIAEQITCPTLVCDAQADLFWPGQPQQLFDHLTCPRTLLRFTTAEGAGAHCQTGAQRLACARIYDWLDDTLATG